MTNVETKFVYIGGCHATLRKVCPGQLEILGPSSLAPLTSRASRQISGCAGAKIQAKVTVNSGIRRFVPLDNYKNQRANQVILYLHGSGYVAGGIDYTGDTALSGSTEWHNRILPGIQTCSNIHSTALDDAMTAYRYLLDQGYRSSQIVLCGEVPEALCFRFACSARPRVFRLHAALWPFHLGQTLLYPAGHMRKTGNAIRQ